MTETNSPIMDELRKTAAAWTQRDIRFREFLEITGFERGYVQGIEKRGLWKYGGSEKGTGNWRAYSVKDMLAFELAHALTGAGFDGETAWAIVRADLDEIFIDCAIMRTRAEFSTMRNTIKITIPTEEIVQRMEERIRKYYGSLPDSAGAGAARIRLNDKFDGDAKQPTP